jgi:glycosyltransferase involved in cell wall biosynthesis
MPPPVSISIVVPVFNEEESLPVLHREIAAALATMGEVGRNAEIIFVDDRSTDRSLERLLELHEHDPRVCVVRFRRNYGQTAALAAGFDVARGRVIVTLDGDLQNDPADIPDLVRELERGFDIVAGWRKKRNDGFVLRRLPSLIANRLIAWVTGVPIHDTGCTLKAFRRELIKSMAIYAEQHRFLPVLSAGSGARISERVVNHRPRLYGQSKYGIGRATRVVLDLMAIKFVSQFSQRPIQYFGTISLLTLASGLVFAVVALFSLGRERGAEGEVAGLGAFGEWEMAVVTILCLLFSAFVYFALLGLLSELAVKASGMHRRSTLDRILNELH